LFALRTLRQRNTVRITSFALSPHERSVVVGLASGAIRILVANEEHLLKKIETVLDQHFFGCVPMSAC
jgi:hypothetical protein